MAEPTIGALWRQWRDVLGRLGFPEAARDAKLLTGAALELDGLAMATRESEPVPTDKLEAVAALMERRLRGEPVARILGTQEFYGLPFGLNAATLVPRPDTELLVDLALAALGDRPATILDLGTGSGCIPIAILANAPLVRAVAIDLSAEALAMARSNAGWNGVDGRIQFILGSWFEPLSHAPLPTPPHEGEGVDAVGGQNGAAHAERHLPPGGGGWEGGHFDLIVSNPPYIETAVIETLAPDVKSFDPRLALDGGANGLAPYRIIAAEARDWLKPNGRLMVEIGSTQAPAVTGLLADAGFGAIAVHRDLAGLDRVVTGTNL